MKFYSFCKKLLQRLIVCFCKLEVINPEKEPASGALVCSNHISNIDPVIIGIALKNQVRFMAKKELFAIPVLGLFLRSFGAFPINRGGVDITAMKKAISLLDEGHYVGMFPQGTRCPEKELRKTSPKNGVGMILSRTESDVLPVAILTKDNKFKFGRKIYVVIGDVINHNKFEFKEKNKEEFGKASSIVFEEICKTYDDYAHLICDKQ